MKTSNIDNNKYKYIGNCIRLGGGGGRGGHLKRKRKTQALINEASKLTLKKSTSFSSHFQIFQIFTKLCKIF